MTRKSHKGITGKNLAWNEDKKNVGPGVNFKDKDLRTGGEIEEAVKKQK